MPNRGRGPGPGAAITTRPAAPRRRPLRNTRRKDFCPTSRCDRRKRMAAGQAKEKTGPGARRREGQLAACGASPAVLGPGAGGNLGAQLLPPFPAPGIDYPTPAAGPAAGAETVSALALQAAGLKGSLHPVSRPVNDLSMSGERRWYVSRPVMSIGNGAQVGTQTIDNGMVCNGLQRSARAHIPP